MAAPFIFEIDIRKLLPVLVAHDKHAAMKTLLVSIAFTMGMVFASHAFALPYCPNGRWEFVCISYEQYGPFGCR
jgi:hypothetical protein